MSFLLKGLINKINVICCSRLQQYLREPISQEIPHSFHRSSYSLRRLFGRDWLLLVVVSSSVAILFLFKGLFA